MSRNYDINKLIDFARQKAVSVKICYWECGDEMSVEVTSAAKAEEFYQKRIVDVDHFIKCWTQHVEDLSTKGIS